MKRLLATGLIALLSVGVAAAQEQPKTPAGVAQALIALENQWGKAGKAGDGAAVGALLAPDFVQLDSDGTLRTKAEIVARTQGGKWVSNEVSDMKVVAHGDTAIVTGSWAGKGTDGTGKAVDGKERWADTWVKTAGGQWLCVASASAPAK